MAEHCTAKPKFQAEWERYHELCYPSGTIEEQRKQLQRAFFAGCTVAVHSVLACSIVEDVAAEKQLQQLIGEVESFGSDQVSVIKARN